MADIVRLQYRVNWAFRDASHALSAGQVVLLPESEATHVNASSPGVLTPVTQAAAPEVDAGEPTSRDIAATPNDRMLHKGDARRKAGTA